MLWRRVILGRAAFTQAWCDGVVLQADCMARRGIAVCAHAAGHSEGARGALTGLFWAVAAQGTVAIVHTWVRHLILVHKLAGGSASSTSSAVAAGPGGDGSLATAASARSLDTVAMVSF